MSLRPMLYAVELNQLRRMLGSGDAQLAREVVERLRADAAADEGEDVEQRLAEVPGMIERLIVEPPPQWADETEGELHVASVDRLASHAGFYEPGRVIADGDWKHMAWDTYLEEGAGELEPTAQRLMEFLVNGRPLLGRQMDSLGAYYAYLERQEVTQLREALEGVPEEVALRLNDEIDGFHDELVGWLGQVEARNEDLWVFAS